MREIKGGIAETKDRIQRLVGVDVRLKVNRGRNNFVNFEGKIKDLYPSVFTFETAAEKPLVLTYSYTDVLTKNVRIFSAD